MQHQPAPLSLPGLEVLQTEGDPYDGVLVNAGDLPVDAEQFSERLQHSLQVWRTRQGTAHYKMTGQAFSIDLVPSNVVCLRGHACTYNDHGAAHRTGQKTRGKGSG